MRASFSPQGARVAGRAGIGMGIALALGAPAVAAKLPPCPPARGQLFIAPMGEPVRAEKGAPSPAIAWFKRVDADHDGRLTEREYMADADRFFAALDKDGDGQLLPEEVAAYERTVPEMALYARRGTGTPMTAKQRREADRAARKGRYDALPTGAGRWSWLNYPEPVSSADTDYDRAVTREEFRAAARARFAALDKGGLGYLSLGRLPQTPAEIAATQCDPTRPWPKPKRGHEEDEPGAYPGSHP